MNHAETKVGGYGPGGCTCSITMQQFCPVHGDNSKRAKAEGIEIDISNGALFLRIMELERTIKWLTHRLDKYESR